MKKNVSAVLLAIVMIISLLPAGSVFATDVAEENAITTSTMDEWGWNVSTEAADVQAIVTTADAYNGNRSLHIKTTGTTAVYLTPKRIESIDPTATYTISFYGKGNGDSIYMLLGKYNDWGKARKPFGSCGKTEDRDGWIKYTHTVDLSQGDETAADFFFILIQAADQDIYVDDFKITKVSSGVDILGGYGSFEVESDLYTYSSTDEWSATCSSEQNTNYAVNIINEVGYNSNRSLHFKGVNAGSEHFVLSSNMVLPVSSTSDYTVSFKIRKSKSGTVTDFDCRMGDSQVWGAGGNIYRVTNIGTEWSTVERTFGNANVTRGLFFTTAGTGVNEFYIDDVKVTCGDTVLLESDFEIAYNMFEETITESSNAEWGWNVSTEAADVQAIVTTADAYNGNRSLHIKTTGTTAVNLTPKRIESIDPTATYTISFYGKGNGDSIYMLLGKYNDWGKARKPFGSCGKADDRDGWIKYTHTVDLSQGDETAADFFFILIQAADQDIYIDDFKITKESSGVDILGGYGSFEKTPVEGYEVSPLKIYAGETEVTALESENEAEKKLTAIAGIINDSVAEGVSAQVIFCLYDGNTLKEVKLSEQKNVLTTDGVVNVRANLVLPVYAADESADYTLKAFLWNGFDKMVPLTEATKIE